jgi:hypothetical protein
LLVLGLVDGPGIILVGFFNPEEEFPVRETLLPYAPIFDIVVAFFTSNLSAYSNILFFLTLSMGSASLLIFSSSMGIDICFPPPP